MALDPRPVVLVFRALGLGDLLTGVPALRGVRRGLPSHRVVLATSVGLAPLVDLADVADEVVPADDVNRLDWPYPPPAIAVNLHGRGPQSHQTLARLRPGRLVGFRCGDWSGPTWRADEHEVARWCRLVNEAFGAAASPTDLELRRPPSSRCRAAGAVVVHPGAAAGARRWPPERFAEVAQWAAERGLPVLVTGGPDETGLTERVTRLAGLPQSCDAGGSLDLVALAALIAHARLLVCGDTGVAHLASAYNTPSVVLFGPVPPERWGPPSRSRHAAIWHSDVCSAGDPHADRVDSALLAITVPEVVSRAEVLLDAPPNAPLAPTRRTA